MSCVCVHFRSACFLSLATFASSSLPLSSPPFLFLFPSLASCGRQTLCLRALKLQLKLYAIPLCSALIWRIKRFAINRTQIASLCFNCFLYFVLPSFPSTLLLCRVAQSFAICHCLCITRCLYSFLISVCDLRFCIFILFRELQPHLYGIFMEPRCQ